MEVRCDCCGELVTSEEQNIYQIEDYSFCEECCDNLDKDTLETICHWTNGCVIEKGE